MEQVTVESLDALAAKHGTDKRSGRHGFAGIYEPYLEPWRDSEVTLLEIGVKEGASLRMWRDYFPQGRILGIDFNASAREHAGERIQVFVGNQRDPRLLDEVIESAGGTFDVIVDDGSHRYPDQRASLLKLWPALRPGGIYVMEDVHTSYLERYGMGYRRRESTIEMLKDLVDDIHSGLHKQRPVLPGVGSVHFFFSTALIAKRAA